MGKPPACPHCGVSIDPPPKRSRKCPHCRASIVVRRGLLLTEQGASELDAKLVDDRARKMASARAERFREARKTTAKELRQAKQSGVVAGVEPLVSENDCRICQAVRGKVFPIGSCTVEMLPPYADCELEDGCRSCITMVLNPECENLIRGSPAKAGGGCLGLALLALVLSLAIMILWQ